MQMQYMAHYDYTRVSLRNNNNNTSWQETTLSQLMPVQPLTNTSTFYYEDAGLALSH